MKKSILFVLAMFAASFSFANCPAPQNVTKVAHSSGSISFDWNNVNGGNPTFEAFYVKDGNAGAVHQTSNSSVTFTNLEPGIYEFHFRAVCGAAVSSEIIIIDEVIIQ